MPENQRKYDLEISKTSLGADTVSFEGPFDIGMETINAENYKVLSIGDVIRLGLDLREKYAAKEGFLYIPNEGTKLVLDSPLFLRPRQVTRAHIEDREASFTPSELEHALKCSIPIPAEGIQAVTRRLHKNEILTSILGGEEEAKVYGELLAERGIKWIIFETFAKSYVNQAKEPFIRQAMITNLPGEIRIDGLGSMKENVNILCGKKIEVN